MKTIRASEFAKLTGVCQQTLRNWDKKGIFPAKKTPTGKLYYTEEDLEKFFEGGKKNEEIKG